MFKFYTNNNAEEHNDRCRAVARQQRALTHAEANQHARYSANGHLACGAPRMKNSHDVTCYHVGPQKDIPGLTASPNAGHNK